MASLSYRRGSKTPSRPRDQPSYFAGGAAGALGDIGMFFIILFMPSIIWLQFATMVFISVIISGMPLSGVAAGPAGY